MNSKRRLNDHMKGRDHLHPGSYIERVPVCSIVPGVTRQSARKYLDGGDQPQRSTIG